MVSTSEPIPPAKAADAPLTFEAWGDLPEDDEGELVDGRLVEEEMPNIRHETIVIALSNVVLNWLGPDRGLIGGSSAKFRVTPRRGRRPDLYVYLPGSPLPAGDAKVVDSPPDVMVEIVSTSSRDQRRDRIEKLGEYEQFGVRYYWIVDPELRSFEILERGADGRYIHAVAITEGRLEAVPGCPGLVVDVDALWKAIDRLATP
jgi:Uma2 family endonuclease